jgi:hypothetical protein
VWEGTWTGVAEYTFHGRVDAVTGAGSGTIDEVFTGRDRDGRLGTIRFAETATLTPTGVPDTFSLRLEMRIVKGTGDFANARGEAVAVGLGNAAFSEGTFSGQWTPGR